MSTEKMRNLINNVAIAGDEWRKWRELLDKLKQSDKGNYRVMFDVDGFFSDEEPDFDDYEFDGDSDRSFAIEKNDETYDNYNNAIYKLAKEINAEVSIPYGNSWYLVKGNKTLTLRDHDVANSTFNHYDEIWSVRHDDGVDENDLTNGINWLLK